MTEGEETLDATPPGFGLRPARMDDFDFARELYFDSMKPLLQALDAWNAEAIEAAFNGYFKLDEIRIVTVDGEDAGWIQVSRTDHELCLDQLHLVKAARNKGIGSTLIKATIAEAAQDNKNVSLSLVKGNRVIKLYKRLGFERVGEDITKIHKRYVTNPVN